MHAQTKMFPSDEEITRRAVALAKQARRPKEWSDYKKQAEEELLDRAAGRALKPWKAWTMAVPPHWR
jgi:hypothetical protein